MNIKASTSLFAACAACLIGGSAAHAASVATGDLLIGFRTTTNDGSQGSGTSYIVNIGQASLYGGDTGAVTNVGADLANIYGSNWASRTDLQWSVVGTVAPNNIYGSQAESTPGVAPAGWNFSSPAAISTVAANIRGAAGNSNPGGFDDSTATINLSAGSELNSSANSWRSFVGPGGSVGNAGSTGNTDFGAFPGNIEGTVGQNLALFHTTGTGVGGTSYVTTFTLDSTGQISAVPEPSSLLTLLGGSSLLVLRRRRRA